MARCILPAFDLPNGYNPMMPDCNSLKPLETMRLVLEPEACACHERLQ